MRTVETPIYLDLGKVGIGRSRVSFQEKEVVCPAGWTGFT